MKLYFYYGVMGSSKTANALMKKFNFEQHGRKVALIKPAIDTRYEKGRIESRIGLSCDAYVAYKGVSIKEILKSYEGFEIIIVDEAQFLTEGQVDELRDMSDNGVMVMCYGLKTDFMGRLFEGSKRLLEVCDTIREIQSMCSKCGKKALLNARYSNGKIIYSGEQVDIGGEEKYITLCHKCWVEGKI